MRFAKRAGALALVIALAMSLTACSKEELREKASDWIIDTATRMGLRDDGSDEEEVELTYASAGGSIVFPEDFDHTEGRMPTVVRDGVMYVGFNGISYRSTQYFVAAGSSVTVTSFASHNNPNRDEVDYKLALWELSDDQTKTSYVPGSTVYFKASAAETCQTYTAGGLTPGKLYKIAVSYDSGSYYITGGLSVTGVGSEELTTIEGAEEE